MSISGFGEWSYHNMQIWKAKKALGKKKERQNPNDF